MKMYKIEYYVQGSAEMQWFIYNDYKTARDRFCQLVSLAPTRKVQLIYQIGENGVPILIDEYHHNKGYWDGGL